MAVGRIKFVNHQIRLIRPSQPNRLRAELSQTETEKEYREQKHAISSNKRRDFLKSKGPPTAGLILAGAAGLGAASLVVLPSLFLVRVW
jgi:hypothetical protein